jgi:glutamate carboxypeptidase
MNYKKIIALALTCFLASGTMAQGLSTTEQKIVQYIQAHQKEAEQLLETTVNINSGSLNIAGVKKVGSSFAKALQDAGFTTEWIAQDIWWLPEKGAREKDFF